MIGTTFSWNQLDQSFDLLIEQFKNDANKNLENLNNELSQKGTDRIFSKEKVYKVISLLCSKEITGVDEKIQESFFKSIAPLLEKKPSKGITEWSWDFFTFKSNNDRIREFCFTAIEYNKPRLAKEIVKLFSESEPYRHDWLALVAIQKGKDFVPFVKERIKKLPQEKANDYINQLIPDSYYNLLHVAIERECQQLVPFLINYGAKIEAISVDKKSPLSLAIAKKMPVEILQNLILHMNDFSFQNYNGDNYLLLALKNKLTLIISLLLDKVNINHQNSQGNTALHLAVAAGLIPEAMEFIKQGANFLLKNVVGEFPLLMAVEQNNKDLNSVMLEKLDLTDPYVREAFERIVELGHTHLAKVFFEKGFTLPLKSRRILFRHAIDKDQEEMAIFLLTPELIELSVQIFNDVLEKGFNRLALKLLESPRMTDTVNFMAACRLGTPELVSTFIEKFNWQQFRDSPWQAVPTAINILSTIIDRDDLHDYLDSVVQRLVECTDMRIIYAIFVVVENEIVTISFVNKICEFYSDPYIQSKKLNEIFVKAISRKNSFVIESLIKKGVGKDLDFSKIDSPDSFLLRTIFANTSLCEQLDKAYLEKLFAQILSNAEQMTADHIKNAQKVLGDAKVKQIVEKFLESSVQELISEKKDDKPKKLTLLYARKLENLFPEITLQVKLLDGSIKVSPFILIAASPIFGMMLSEKWKKDTFKLGISFSHFKKIYDYLSKNTLDFSEIEDTESQIDLKASFNLYQIDPPVGLGFGKKLIQENDIKEFLKKPYNCLNKKNLTISSSLFKTNGEPENYLSNYLLSHPDITKMKIEVDARHPTIILASSFPKIPLIHLDLKNADIDLKFGCSRGYSVFLSRIKKLKTPILNYLLKCCNIAGLDLSNRDNIDVEKTNLKHLRYLNLSNIPISWEKLKDFANSKLKELVLTDCQCVTDENIHDLSMLFPHLTSIHLDGNFVKGEAVIQFVKTATQLKRIRLPQFSDEILKEIIHTSKELEIYVGKKRVITWDDQLIKETKLSELIDLALQNEIYLLDSHVNDILNRLFDQIKLKGELPPHTSDAFNSLLKIIETRQTQTTHPLNSFTQKLTDSSERLDFYLNLSPYFQDHHLDNYLSCDEVSALYLQFVDFAKTNQLSFEQARQLSRLFSSKIAPLTNISITGSKKSYSFHPLVLMSASKKLQEMFKSSKIYRGDDEKIIQYIHSYLQTGKIDLKNINLSYFLDICQFIENQDIAITDFLQAAEGNEISLEVLPYASQILIQKFLEHPTLKTHVTTIDLAKANLNSQLLSKLVKEATSLKQIRLSPLTIIDDQLWDALIQKRIEVLFVLKNADEVPQFHISDPVRLKESQCQIRLELKGIHFSTLSNYLTFVQKIPSLLEIDLSPFSPCTKPEDLKLLEAVLQISPPKILNLGDFSALTETELNNIARCCRGLKVLKGKGNPELCSQIFSHYTILESCEIEKS